MQELPPPLPHHILLVRTRLHLCPTSHKRRYVCGRRSIATSFSPLPSFPLDLPWIVGSITHIRASKYVIYEHTENISQLYSLNSNLTIGGSPPQERSVRFILFSADLTTRKEDLAAAHYLSIGLDQIWHNVKKNEGFQVNGNKHITHESNGLV